MHNSGDWTESTPSDTLKHTRRLIAVMRKKKKWEAVCYWASLWQSNLLPHKLENRSLMDEYKVLQRQDAEFDGAESKTNRKRISAIEPFQSLNLIKKLGKINSLNKFITNF